MEHQKRVMNFVYILVSVDVVLVLTLLILNQLLASSLVLVCGFPLLLGFNYMLARRRLLALSAQVREEHDQRRGDIFWLYTGATLYFAGALYGLFLILGGEFPLAALPALLIPSLLGFYFLRAARRSRARSNAPTSR